MHELFVAVSHSLRVTTELLAYSTIIYIGLALLVKGRQAIAGRSALAAMRVNLGWTFLDAIIVAPLIAVAVTSLRFVVEQYSLEVMHEQAWQILWMPVVGLIAVFLGDFISYWRHRLEHTPWLWPAHAIHHSDTEMSWLTLARFHPVNRLVTSCIDFVVLSLLGFPAWALIANHIVRHYYGEFIHADVPWTYGPLGRVFVSPAMHQWHHARDVEGAGSNFATVFSVFDLAFGTYYVPGRCNVPLGVTEDVGKGVVHQLIYPFGCWLTAARDFVRDKNESRASGGWTDDELVADLRIRNIERPGRQFEYREGAE
jgi:sterol desaturase/sphingolipid hydroxylase (fatty acid hydroxylase superfamily)